MGRGGETRRGERGRRKSREGQDRWIGTRGGDIQTESES